MGKRGRGRQVVLHVVQMTVSSFAATRLHTDCSLAPVRPEVDRERVAGCDCMLVGRYGREA